MTDLFALQKSLLKNAFNAKIRLLLDSNPVDVLAFQSVFTESQRIRSYLNLGWIDINSPITAQSEFSLLHIVSPI